MVFEAVQILTPEVCAAKWLKIWNTANSHLLATSSTYDDQLEHSLSRASVDDLLVFLKIVMSKKLYSHTASDLGAGIVESFLRNHPRELEAFKKLEEESPQFMEVIAGVWVSEEMTAEVQEFLVWAHEVYDLRQTHL